MKTCCVNCFANPWIADCILANDEVGDCDYCGAVNVRVSTVAVVGSFVRERIECAFAPSALHEYPLEESEEIWHEATGIELLVDWEAVFSSAVLALGLERRLAADLFVASGPLPFEIANGAVDDLDGGDAYLLRRGTEMGETRFAMSWDHFTTAAVAATRDCVQADEGLLHRLLEELAEVFAALTVMLDPGTDYWRARPGHLEELREPRDQATVDVMGPPPAEKAKSFRLNREGEAYFYLGQTQLVCLAETSDRPGNRRCVARYRLKRSARVIDLTRRIARSPYSIFCSEFDPDQWWIADFIEEFDRQVSAQVTDADAPEQYAPTQTLAGYARAQGYNGIVYSSSRCPRGVNAVFFCGPRAPGGGRMAVGRREIAECAAFTELFELVGDCVDLTISRPS
jgi:hypothetical protein